MNIRTDQSHAPKSNTPRTGIPDTIDSEIVLRARTEGLNVELVGPISLLPYGQKCGIRFGADATVTIMLGMRDRWRDYASPYFMSVLVTHLGIPIERVRLYYTGVHPAVRRTLWHSRPVPSRDNVGAAIVEIGDLIEALCDRVIERGRHFLAVSIDVLPADIDFDASSGRFVVPGKKRYVDVLELAKCAGSDGYVTPTNFNRLFCTKIAAFVVSFANSATGRLFHEKAGRPF
jgi:hypothetical protein